MLLLGLDTILAFRRLFVCFLFLFSNQSIKISYEYPPPPQRCERSLACPSLVAYVEFKVSFVNSELPQGTCLPPETQSRRQKILESIPIAPDPDCAAAPAWRDRVSQRERRLIAY
eukprot:765252-Hanusia_phi.AAC.4